MMSPGSRIMNYEVVELIGSGSQGLVYLCRHTRLDRVDAVKVLLARLSDNPSARSRFEREAAHAARLQHVNIATIHDAGETPDGFLYVAMRYVPGPDLAKLIRADRLRDLKRAYRLIEGLGSALDAAHAAGLVHRDVKPSNVLVEHESTTEETAVLVDFGISKWWYEARSGTNTAMGTYAYLAPERIVGHAGDDRSDQYSLGCTTYECLTGEPPFPSHSPAQIVKAHLESPPPKASESRPGLPPAVDRVLSRALAKNPMDRFPSCGVFVTALRDALELDAVAVPVLAGATASAVGAASIKPGGALGTLTGAHGVLKPPASVSAATALNFATHVAMLPTATDDTTVPRGRPNHAVPSLPRLPSVPRRLSVLSLVAAAVLLAAYGMVLGTRGQTLAVGLGLGLDVVAFVLAMVARRRGRPRNHRARTLAPVVILFAVAFVGVTYYLYPAAAADLVNQVRGFAGDLASLVRPHSGSA